ncbi:MotA/TolQ/ExbB proton channel family protein [uncultured Megasphaera sp.]|uniref:MotA/TolQ/ExbB proton channel family protein n=1 Tax=uncultured Megasphaera sp. TaxID=165188 RepID=UPI002658794C|nr:MotA/TolQ/ExbB proton channel family protein [uncultured Megasphaera sp.]
MEGFAYFLHLFHSGGLVMYPLLALSIFTVAIAIERFCYYRANRKDSKKFCIGITHAVQNDQWDAAEAFCKKSPTAISRIIANGLKHRDSEKGMKEAFNEQMTVESVAFRRYLDYLSATVTISPLLGLLGTVTGMISTFSVLDNGAGASAITGGVGEALIATATGLCVAIIAFCVYTYFDHQLDTIVTDTEKLCVTVVNSANAK